MYTIYFSGVLRQLPDVAIHETVLDSGETFGLHNHDFYEIFYIAQGKVIHNLNDVSTIMEKGEFHFIYPDDAHGFIEISEEPSLIVNYSFTEEFLAEMLSRSYAERFVRKGKFSPSEMTQAEETLSMLTRVEISPRNDLNQKQALLQSFMQRILISRALEESNQEMNIPPWLKETVDALKNPEVMQEGIKGMVEFCGFTQEHLTRQLKKYYGRTPSQIVNTYRINSAKRLLSATKLSVLDISMQVGFENVSYFNRVFMDQTGLSPKAYRKQIYNLI